MQVEGTSAYTLEASAGRFDVSTNTPEVECVQMSSAGIRGGECRCLSTSVGVNKDAQRQVQVQVQILKGECKYSFFQWQMGVQRAFSQVQGQVQILHEEKSTWRRV